MNKALSFLDRPECSFGVGVGFDFLGPFLGHCSAADHNLVGVPFALILQSLDQIALPNQCCGDRKSTRLNSSHYS